MRYLFHYNHQDHVFERPENGATRRAEAGHQGSKPTKIFGNNGKNRRIQYAFNDAGLYLRLKKAQGCLSVDISSVQVLYNNHCLMGLHVEYRSTFADGSETRTKAAPHHHNHGKHAKSGGKAQAFTFSLKDNEYITDVLTRQGDVTTQITFLTNMGRKESFGGMEGEEELPTSRTENYRVVALAGTVDGVIETVGFFAEPMTDWKMLKSFLLGVNPERNGQLLELKKRKTQAVYDKSTAEYSPKSPLSEKNCSDMPTRKRRRRE